MGRREAEVRVEGYGRDCIVCGQILSAVLELRKVGAREYIRGIHDCRYDMSFSFFPPCR